MGPRRGADTGVSPEDDVVGFRLAAVEKAIGEFRSELRGVKDHVDERLDRVQGSIASLQFVRQDVYASEARARREYELETRKLAVDGIAEAKALARTEAASARQVAVDEAVAAKRLIVIVAGMMLTVLGIVAGLIKVAGG